ncbi:MAG: hypothetical protein GY772_06585 [bacterium]|nr:hypothetical protein [bacterium]
MLRYLSLDCDGFTLAASGSTRGPLALDHSDRLRAELLPYFLGGRQHFAKLCRRSGAEGRYGWQVANVERSSRWFAHPPPTHTHTATPATQCADFIYEGLCTDGSVLAACPPFAPPHAARCRIVLHTLASRTFLLASVATFPIEETTAPDSTTAPVSPNA